MAARESHHIAEVPNVPPFAPNAPGSRVYWREKTLSRPVTAVQLAGHGRPRRSQRRLATGVLSTRIIRRGGMAPTLEPPSFRWTKRPLNPFHSSPNRVTAGGRAVGDSAAELWGMRVKQAGGGLRCAAHHDGCSSGAVEDLSDLNTLNNGL